MAYSKIVSVAGRTLSLLSAVLIGFSCPPAKLAAQSLSIRFDRLSLEQGLSQGTVNCILQDRVGFLWVGTQDGLNRYDGYGFRVYKQDPTDPASLASNWVTAIAEGPAGDLWVGTEGGGVSRWHRASDTFTHFKHDAGDPASIPSNRVRVLLFDRKGALWVGTFQSGLARRDPDTGAFERFRHDPTDAGSLADDRIRSIYEDRPGNLWIGTLAGLARFDRATGLFVRFKHDPADPTSLSDDRISSILEDHLGSLWIGTEKGLNRRDPGPPQAAGSGFVRYLSDPAAPASLSHDLVRALLEDQERRLWIGTDGGISLLQGRSGEFSRYRSDAADPNSLSHDRVMTLFQDRGGVLWVGTQGGGLSKWNPATWSFSHYRADPTSEAGLSSNAVFAFSEDAAGRMWIGTLGGLHVFDRAAGRFTRHRHDPQDPRSLSDERVMALLHDREGVLWAGTQAGGLNRLDPLTLPSAPATARFRHYRHDLERPDSLSDDQVTSLFEDREGALWVGTFRGGLNRRTGATDTFERFRHDPADPQSLSDDQVTSFADGDQGALWVGTFGGGLNLFARDAGAFRRFLHDPDRPSSLSSDTVFSLRVDAGGTLWVGTRVGLNKLVRLDEATGEAVFEHYFERHGLPSDSIWGVHCDARGDLWLSTNNGLSRFDPRRETFKSYDPSHGLQGKEFNFGAHFRTAEGELFFGGTNGFNAFFPERIESNTSPPPVVLTAFTKLNQPVPLEQPVFDLEEIALDYRDDIVSFEFAALDYTAPEKNQYRYKLEGFHDDWIDNGRQRWVSFTNLDPGHYVLKVQASNNDGVWNEQGLSLAIDIAPPFWQTWWFRAGVALAIAGAVWVGHLVRVRNIRRHNEELRILVRERTRELEEAQERLVRQERLAVLGELAGSVAHEIRNPLGIIKNSSFYLRRTQQLAGEKAAEHLAMIDREIQRTNLIITELLDYARDRSPELRRFPLQQAADKALADIAVPDAVRVERRFEAEPVIVEADPGQIERLLANLMRNAVQAMPDGGTLSLACCLNDGKAIATVADTGIGIAEENLGKIFEPLFTTKAKGIGLGLALSQRYAQLNRGRLECESSPGQGATFRLVLPAPPAASAEAPADREGSVLE